MMTVIILVVWFLILLIPITIGNLIFNEEVNGNSHKGHDRCIEEQRSCDGKTYGGEIEVSQPWGS